MKKYIPVIIISVLFSVLCTSCSLLSGDTSARLSSYTDKMVKDYIVSPVLSINEAEYKGKKDIFKEDFKLTEKGKYEITLLSATDSTWSFSQVKDNGKYKVNGKIKMLPRNDIGLTQWLCSATVSYDEGNGYTSILSTSESAQFYWTDHLKTTEYIYRMVFDGKFVISTYLSDKPLDTGTATYYQSETDSVISDDWELVTYRETADE